MAQVLLGNEFYDTGTTISTKTSETDFDNNVKVSNVKITYAYSQEGYDGGNGSILDSTLNFYDKNNNLLHTITPTRINTTSHNDSKYKTYDVPVNLKGVRHIVLTSTGRNVGGYCIHRADITYTDDFTSEMIKDKVKEAILNNELIKNHCVTCNIES